MKGRVVAAGLAAVVALSGGCGGRAEQTGPATGTQIVRVVREDVPLTVVATGTVGPEVGAEVKVGPRISGVLEKLYVHVGDHVRAGALLARLDDRQLRAEVRAAESDVRSARANLESASTRVALASAVLLRRKALARSGLVSAEDLDVRTRELELARSEEASARARLDQARTRLDQARIELGYATIHAPISGTVTTVATQEGETVAASFAVPTFVTIMDLDRLQVETYVDEVDIGKVKTGQDAEITVDAFPNETFEGNVTAVSPEARIHDNVVTYVVLVSLTSANRRLLRPKMTASVTITAGERKGLLLLPVTAVRRDEAGAPWVMIRKNGRDERLPVRLGEMFGNDVEVREGVEEGDEVIVDVERRNGRPQ